MALTLILCWLNHGVDTDNDSWFDILYTAKSPKILETTWPTVLVSKLEFPLHRMICSSNPNPKRFFSSWHTHVDTSSSCFFGPVRHFGSTKKNASKTGDSFVWSNPTVNPSTKKVHTSDNIINSAKLEASVRNKWRIPWIPTNQFDTNQSVVVVVVVVAASFFFWHRVSLFFLDQLLQILINTEKGLQTLERWTCLLSCEFAKAPQAVRHVLLWYVDFLFPM